MKSPLKYRIGGMDLGGITVNASRAGIMVKSSIPSETAFEMLRVLDNESNSHAQLEVGLDSETHLIDARVKHFHLDSSEEAAYVLRVGFEFLNAVFTQNSGNSINPSSLDISSDLP